MDLIERQAAIDELGYCQTYLFDSRDKDKKISLEDAEYAIEQLPSAQPDIIHCRECKNCQIDSVFHDYWCDGRKVWKDHYCGYAERRTDEQVN